MATVFNQVIDSRVLVHGKRVPAVSWSVDINAYSIASTIDVTVPKEEVAGFYHPPHGDWCRIAQDVRPLPFEVHFGIGHGGTTPQTMTLESGYVDDVDTRYGERNVVFTGRGAASLFQDVQITAPQLRNARGSDIIASIFKKRGVPLTIVDPSPTFGGKTNNDQLFDQAMRGRSEWDVMQAIAVADGFRLTMHNGRGTYGPYLNNDPILSYYWGQAHNNVGIIDLDIRHSPRRSHNIRVIARSYQPRSKRYRFRTYGSANSTSGETFDIPVAPGLNTFQLEQRAQAIYLDIAKREFLLDADIAPDLNLVAMVANVGANFSIRLHGGDDLMPSHKLLYEVRQIHFEKSKGRGGIPVRAHIVAGNLNPIQTGGFLQS